MPGIETVKDCLSIIHMKACLEEYSFSVSVFHGRMANIYVISVLFSLTQVAFLQFILVGYVPGLAAVALLLISHQTIMALLVTTVAEFFNQALLAV